MWSCDSHTLFASLCVQTFSGKRLRIAKLRDWHLRQKRRFHMFRKSTPETAADDTARFRSLTDNGLVRGSSGNQPAVHIPFRYKRAESCDLRKVQIFVNSRVDDGKKTGEPRGPKSFGRERGIRRFQQIEANGQKQFWLGLKFVDPPAESYSIGFEKYAMTALRKGANKMTNPGMKQRLIAANPNHRSRILHQRMHLFAGNRSSRAGMEDFRGINAMENRSRWRRVENLRDAGFCEF